MKTYNKSVRRNNTSGTLRLLQNTACAAILLLTAAACGNESTLEEVIPPAGKGTPITLNATIGTDKNTDQAGKGEANTRVGIIADGDAVSNFWQEKDAFRLYTTGVTQAGATNAGVFTLYKFASIMDDKNAKFRGDLLVPAPTEGSNYTAYYPASQFPETITKEALHAIRIDEQKQVEANNGDALANINFMEATGISNLNSNLVFKPMLTLINIVTTMPDAASTKREGYYDGLWGKAELKMIADGKPIFSKHLFPNENDPNDYANQVTLKLEDVVVNGDRMKIKTVMLVHPFKTENQILYFVYSNEKGDFLYQATNKNSYSYNRGVYYKVSPHKDYWQQMNRMKFTIKVEADNLGFNIPFPTEGKLPATLLVQWGDNSSTIVKEHAELSANDDFNHTYAQPGTYTVSISSAALKPNNVTIDPTPPQIPALRFGYNRTENANATKLLSLDTPLLNVEEADMSGAFMGCTNLTSVPKDLFPRGGVAITNLSHCFDGCTSLVEIPKVFDTNDYSNYNYPSVTDYSYFFANCTKLTKVSGPLPESSKEGVNLSYFFYNCTSMESINFTYDNYKKADFSHCYEGCTSLKEVKSKFNGLYTDDDYLAKINSCFKNCTALTNIPDKIFRYCREITDISSCFENCTSLETVPDNLFEYAINADNLSNCFANCTKLTLKGNIFVDGKFNHFPKNANFTNCFLNAGAEATTIGTAPALWKFAKPDGAAWTTTDCFTGCKITNAGDVPSDGSWGTPAAASPDPVP